MQVFRKHLKISGFRFFVPKLFLYQNTFGTFNMLKIALKFTHSTQDEQKRTLILTVTSNTITCAKSDSLNFVIYNL